MIMDLFAYMEAKRQASQQPVYQDSYEVPQTPQIDTSTNTMKSLAQMLGPTPQEYEEQQRQERNHRDQMMKWTALFDGMRNLANLYYTARGANPQQYTDNPYAGVEQRYQQDLKENAANAEYRRSYGKALWDMQQKINANERAAALQNAQIQWYGARGEAAKQKAEMDKLKAEKQNALTDARRANVELKTKQLGEIHPKRLAELDAKIAKALRDANKPYSSGKGGRGKSSSNDPFVSLAENLEDYPEIVGPILQEQGLGTYDASSKKFLFKKNPSKGIATEANTRVNKQRGAVAPPSRQRAQSGAQSNTPPSRRKRK